MNSARKGEEIKGVVMQVFTLSLTMQSPRVCVRLSRMGEFM